MRTAFLSLALLMLSANIAFAQQLNDRGMSQAIRNRIDQDRSNSITATEYNGYFQSWGDHYPFLRYDTNGDGTLTNAELDRFIMDMVDLVMDDCDANLNYTL